MSGLIPIVARAAGSGAIKKIATRVVAGITGAGAKTVTPVYRNSGSVKPFPGGTKYQADTVNKMRTEFVNNRKSGVTAKKSAAIVEKVNREIPKKPTVKINSNMRAR